MKPFLQNPVYDALISGDQHLAFGTDAVKYFHQDVSPFAGFPAEYIHGFEELHDALPANHRILYATPAATIAHKGWQLMNHIKGVQMIFENLQRFDIKSFHILPLQEQHTDEMVNLATLTQPGPFAKGTIDFGSYFGIFENGKLVAMTGQRLHPEPYTEVSAVCTHPNSLGKGYATALVQHQVQLILAQNHIPVLHVRQDNTRAISMYQRLGFVVSGEMNFYFLKKD